MRSTYKNNKFLFSIHSPVTTPKLSSWKNNLLACHHLGDVQVEEVTVEDGLNDPGYNGDGIVEILIVIAVDPVEDVEATVRAESKEIVAGDGLRLAGLADHEELGEDGDTLQVDGECPEDFHHRELMVEPQSQEEAGYEQELYSEAVVVRLIFGLKNKY